MTNFSKGDDFTKTVHSEPYPAIDSSKANLHGKSVFICGASKGIGRCIALSYAKAGASYIAIGARSDLTTVEKDVVEVARAVGKTTPKVLQVKVDVTNVESVGKAAHEIGKRFPQLDIVIYNAGVVGQMVPILDSDPDKWWNTWDINLRGAFLVTRAFLPVQLKGGDKQIAYTSSCGAWLALPGLSDYQPTKLALSRFTEFVGVEYGEQGIVAFSIHPGNVVTEIVGPDGPPEHLKHSERYSSATTRGSYSDYD